MRDFQNKIAVITGAGSGMGRALAVQLSGAGAKVLLSDKNTTGLEETRKLVEAGKGICKTYIVDVGNKDQVYAFAKQVLDEYSYIDVLINNAGMAIGEATLNEIPLEDFERLMNVNLWGVIHHTKAFLDVLISRTEAAIVNTSSECIWVDGHSYPDTLLRFEICGARFYRITQVRIKRYQCCRYLRSPRRH